MLVGISIDDLYSTFDANSQTDAFKLLLKMLASIQRAKKCKFIAPVKAYPSQR